MVFSKKACAVLSVMFCLLIATSALSSCSSTTDNSSSETALTEETTKVVESQVIEPVELSMYLYGAEIANAQQVEDTYSSIFQEYELKTKNKIELIFLPSDNAHTWMITQFAAGTIPEILKTRRVWAWEDYTKGLIHDLGPYLENENPYMPGQKWKDTFTPNVFRQTIDPANNVSSCVPFQVVTGKIIYNKDLFAQAGVVNEPQTWQEYMDACKKLEEAGIVPFGFANSKMSDNDFHWLLSSAFGELDVNLRKQMDVDGDGQVIKNEQARATDLGLIDFSKSPFKESFEMVKELSQYFNSDFNAVDRKTNMEMWLSGKVAMLMLGSWEVIAIETMADRNFEYGALSSPYFPKETNPNASGMVTMIGGSPVDTYAITKVAEGDKLAAAIDFLQYLTSREIQEKCAKDLYYIPVVDGVDLPESIKGFMVQDNEDIVRSNYTGPATSQEFSDFLCRMGQMYLTDKIGFEEFSSALNEEWKKAMENAKKANNWTKENNYGM